GAEHGPSRGELPDLEEQELCHWHRHLLRARVRPIRLRIHIPRILPEPAGLLRPTDGDHSLPKWLCHDMSHALRGNYAEERSARPVHGHGWILPLLCIHLY